ncbi:MAG: Pycsar system effector family protein [Thalassolituus sp.]|jgi:hypothetical protein|uniref:Pycsar system effector family protein n=1 Tax=Thalassolituus sp. TaxID=2030822 RepID=UPI003982B1D4
MTEKSFTDQNMPPADLSLVNSNEVVKLLQAMHHNHLRLNVMADQKANILMGIIGIMFTVILTKLTSTESYDTHIQFVLAVFIALELVAFTASLLVIAPKFHGSFMIENLDSMPNPFFFGFYTKFREDDYIQHMMTLITDDEAAKIHFYKDIYQMGVILKQKYKQLRRAYFFAFLGVAASILLFLGDLVFNIVQS